MALLEVLSPRGYPSVTLDGDRLTIGKSDDNDLVIDADSTLSRHHAVIEQVGRAWSIHDVGSKNGTRVNGEHLFGDRVLKHGDELLLGQTALLFRDAKTSRDDTTKAKAEPPQLTRREHDVLVELCRPALSGSAFTPPATVREVADALYVGEAAIKQHLGRMYDKFDIDNAPNRRVRLANAAMDTGSVRRGDLDKDPE